jgi:threonine dehydrogenase-like Zn-dependent dehydrogenase
MGEMGTETIFLPNETLTCFGLDKIEIRSKPVELKKGDDGRPVPLAECVLVRVRATGICGSDVSIPFQVYSKIVKFFEAFHEKEQLKN